MLKLLFLLTLIGSALTQFCPTDPITKNQPVDNLPYGAKNLTAVPQGTNCTFMFTIPDNYSLKLSLNVQGDSKSDAVTIYDNQGQSLYGVKISAEPIFNIPLWMPARAASVRVEAGSANMKFMLSYMYQSLADYKKVTKRTGEYFPLNDIAANTYVTITASSANDKVIVSPATREGAKDNSLNSFYVYDGDNINTANVMGRLSDMTDMRMSSGQSVSIVNLDGLISHSYALGNDASSLSGYSKYKAYITTLGSSIRGNISDLSDAKDGAGYTWLCIDCSTFYLTSMKFDTYFAASANTGYFALQGQTPTQKLDKLIRYDVQTVTDSYFPQALPTNVFTISLKLSTAMIQMNTGNDDSAWRKPYDGRKGYIIAPNLWGKLDNSFNYEFRDDSKLYNFTVNVNKMTFAATSDKMTVKIGSGTGTPAVNQVFSQDQSSNKLVSSKGNYMQTTLSAAVGADVRLFFEMWTVNSSSAIGVLTTVLVAVYQFF